MGIGARVEETKSDGSQDIEEFYPEQPKFTLNDLIVDKKTLDSIHNALAIREHGDLVFNRWGFSKTHKQHQRVAMNLYGPPGTGKTLAAHAIADHLRKPIISINYADIESKYVGDTPKNIVKAFSRAKKYNAILFFDEADAILSRRVTNMHNSTDVSVNQTRSVMLILLNDYEETVLFATNFIENYDPAFMRRIASHIYFDLPDEECRAALFRKNIPDSLPNDIDIQSLAKISEGVSGSDIATALLMAAFHVAQKGHDSVTTQIVEFEICSIIKSRNDNIGNVKTSDRIVSADYVSKNIGIK